ncbi:MAG: MarR family transcriptional regulator [Trueperaceae bacterium]|nr:MarR family transcriptional regulator [Trueperaceae bacterium]
MTGPEPDANGSHSPSAPDAGAQAFLRFVRIYMRSMVDDMSALLKDHGLSMPQVAALQYLHAEAPATVTAIASHLNLTMAATSHLVERLVVKGLVRRTENARDRRQKQVALSAAGRELVAESHARAAAVLDALLSDVSPAKRAAMATAVHAVVDELTAANGDVDGASSCRCVRNGRTGRSRPCTVVAAMRGCSSRRDPIP